MVGVLVFFGFFGGKSCISFYSRVWVGGGGWGIECRIVVFRYLEFKVIDWNNLRTLERYG